jgi:hypothetical protein
MAFFPAKAKSSSPGVPSELKVEGAVGRVTCSGCVSVLGVGSAGGASLLSQAIVTRLRASIVAKAGFENLLKDGFRKINIGGSSIGLMTPDLSSVS